MSAPIDYQPPKKFSFTPYQIFVIAIIAFIQFTVVLDFMVLSPLGAILMPKLNITTEQFGYVVSAYAVFAGLSGILAAGFADKFDRKKLLLVFYLGFVVGTLFCALSNSYAQLMAARIFTGIFGGVLGSIGMAIITDLFPLQARGRVMGFTQMAFSASQVLGLPISLYLAKEFDWHAPFFMIVAIAALVGVIILWRMQPVNEHLKHKHDGNPFVHLLNTLTKKEYLIGYMATVLLATGGYMMMPFGTAFAKNNLGLNLDDLPLLYLITGIVSLGIGPLIGILSDKMGKYTMFMAGTIISIVMVIWYTNLGPTGFWFICALNVILFSGIMARIIPAQALTSAVPEPRDRGAYMSINASIQQLSGAIASASAGLIVTQNVSGKLEHYPTMGYVVAASMIVTLFLMYLLFNMIRKKTASSVVV